MTDPITPLGKELPAADEYAAEPDARFRLACWLAATLPPGRGAIPRLVGRSIGRGIKSAVTTSNGARLVIDPLHLDVFTSIACNAGGWDDHVLDVCLRLLQPDNVFYDIGANAGYMAISAGYHFRHERIHVVAFEPQPSLARAILRSAALNRLDDVQVFECLLGETQGRVDLFVPAHGIHASTVARGRRVTRLECQQTAIDVQVETGTIPPPDVMKVDVEGAELAVFRGALETIRAHAPAIVFESDANMTRFGYHRSDVFELLGDLADYAFCAITAQGLVRVDNAGGETLYPDIVAVPPRLRGLIVEAVPGA